MAVDEAHRDAGAVIMRTFSSVSHPVPVCSVESSTPVSRAEEGAHVLVVDDDQAVRELAATILERAGFQVTTAHDGEAGWSVVQSRPIDLIVTDNEMPRLRGLDLILRLRNEGFTRPIILVSGGLLPGDAAMCPAIGRGGFMSKPFTAIELVQAVRRWLNEPALNDQCERLAV
jgi:CheY-like chemotaxis protein